MLPRVPVYVLRQTTFAAVCVFAIVSLGSCDKVPLLAPTESVITLVSSRSVLPINGTAQIIATVIEQSGTPAHNGTLVTFTSTLGTLEPQEALTSNGQAVVTLRAGTQSGVAEIFAFSGSARTETAVMVTIGAAAAVAVTLSATPAAVPSIGGTVTITASVSDASGNRLPGVPILFSTTAGTLGASQVITDAAGTASTTLFTTSAATVTATVSGTVTGTVMVAVNAAPTIAVTTSTTTPTAGDATVFSVTTTAPGSPITNVSIDFGDGASLSLGSLTGTSSVSHVYASAGTYTVVGTVTDSSGEKVSVTTVITVASQTPLNVTLTGPTTNPTVNSPVTFTAAVTPLAVAISRFEWTFGDGTSVDTSGGSTSHAYSSAGLKTVQVTAVASNGREGTAQTQVLVVQGTATASFTKSPTSGSVGTTITFNASASTASTGGTISTYEWNFGDSGNVAICPGNSLCGSGNRTVTHAYTDPGTYTITLTITDSNGSVAVATDTIDIS